MACKAFLDGIHPWALCREDGFEDVLVGPISSDLGTISFDSPDVCPYEKFRRNISVDNACVAIREGIASKLQNDVVSGTHLPVSVVVKAMRYARVPSIVFVMMCLDILESQHSISCEKEIGKTLGLMRPLDVLRCASANIKLGLCVLCGTPVGENFHQWVHDGIQLKAHIQCLQSRVIKLQVVYIPSWAEWPIRAIRGAVLKVRFVGTDECIVNVQLKASPRIREVSNDQSTDVTLVVCGSLAGFVDVWAKHKRDFLVVMESRHECRLIREVARCGLEMSYNKEVWENLGMGDIDYKEHIKCALKKRE